MAVIQGGTVIEGNTRQEKVARVQLTNAQMLALRATPVTLIAAPPTGQAIIVESVLLVFDVMTTAYTESTDNLTIEYATSGTDILVVETTGFLDQTTDQIRYQAPNFTVLTPSAAEAVRIKNDGDGEFGGGNAANTLSIEVRYSVVEAAAFS